MKEAWEALAEGFKDSFRLAAWILVSLVETIGAFVNHRDLNGRHKHG